MAIVTFKKSELEQLIGMKLDSRYYKEIIPMMGAPLESMTNDEVSFEIFPNRPDMLSIEGFTRNVRYFLGLEDPKRYTSTPYKISVFVDKSVKNTRPFIVSAVIRNVDIDEDFLLDLMQFQEKIHETFGRKRKKIAIGIHDLDMVKPPFYYKAVGGNEVKFVPLDMDKEMTLENILEKHPKGIKYKHLVSDKYPILVDSENNVLSFPPIINGELTRVTENTKNLFIDITGTHLDSLKKALNIITTSMADRGFIVESVRIVDGNECITPDFKERTMNVDLNYIKKIIGINISVEKFVQLLKRAGLDYNGHVLIPPYRTDIMHQIDIAEDVAIAYGYENIEPELPGIFTRGTSLRENDFKTAVASLMNGMMFQEVRTMILSSQNDQNEKMNTNNNLVEILNAKSDEFSVCRRDLMPGILNVFSQNKHVDYPQSIFEMGKIVFLGPTETGADETNMICAASSPGNYSNISSVLKELLSSLKLKFKIIERNDVRFISGRAGTVVIDGDEIGVIGEVHPSVLNKWKVEKPVALFELDMRKIFLKMKTLHKS